MKSGEIERDERGSLQRGHGEFSLQRGHGEFKEENTIENETSVEIYSLRWWIGLFYTCQVILLRMLMNSFGYFNISFYAIDWFLVIQYVGMYVSAMILILMILSKRMAFRKLFIMLTTCTICSYACSMVAFSFPRLFWLIYIGQFVAGIALPTSIAIFSTFATAWFPENQIGIAMNVKSLGMCVGCLLAFLVPSQLVPPPPQTLIDPNFARVTANNVSTTETENNKWIDEVRWKFLSLYGGSVLGCVVIGFFVIIFVTDEPPKPPTAAQALVRSQRLRNQTEKTWATFSQCWNEYKSIYQNKTIVYAGIILIVLFSTNYVQKVLMGQISREVFSFRKFGIQINKMVGYILVLYEIGGIFGSITTAILMDCLNHHKLIMCIGISFTLFCTIGLSVGQYIFNVSVIFVLNTLLGFFICLNHIPLFDIVLQETFPKDTSLVILMFFTTSDTGSVIIGQFCRLILSYTNGSGVLIFVSVLLLLGVAVCMLLNPNLKRQEASKGQANEIEGQPLLDDR